MNQAFLSVIAVIIAFILWSSKKQSKGLTFFKSQNDSFSKDYVTSSSLVIDKSFEIQKQTKMIAKKSKPPLTQLSINSFETKKKLTKLISSNPSDRLLAIEIASQWNSNKALPFLRRGLRDSDSRVVIASAAGISSFRGKTIEVKKKPQALRLPRNMSRMR